MNKLIVLTLATLSLTATAFADIPVCTPTTPRGTLCQATNGMSLRSCGDGRTFLLPAAPISSCDGKGANYDPNGKLILTKLSPTKS